jgi:hypothetical protein
MQAVAGVCRDTIHPMLKQQHKAQHAAIEDSVTKQNE